MRSTFVLPLVAALALTACGKSDGPKSGEEVKEAMESMVKPTPGLYRSSMKLTNIEMPGVPEAQVNQMKTAMASAQQGGEFCLTQADADKGYEEMTKKLAQGNCTFDRFDASGNNIDAKLSCQTAQNQKGTVEMKGTVSETGSTMNMTVEQPMPTGSNMKMSMEVKSERIGDCPAAK